MELSERKNAFAVELRASLEARRCHEHEKEWHHLERAHVLGQFHSFEHFWVHLMMMRFSIAHYRLAEFIGQIPRILLAIPGSISGRAPRGNTGGAEVGLFETMEIPSDLKVYFFPKRNTNDG